MFFAAMQIKILNGLTFLWLKILIGMIILQIRKLIGVSTTVTVLQIASVINQISDLVDYNNAYAEKHSSYKYANIFH